MDFPTDKNFMYMEDNGDNTITATARFEGMDKGMTVLIPMSFEDFANSFGMAGNELLEIAEDTASKMVHIPDSPPED